MPAKLILENWFCIEKLELTLDRPLTVVVGGHEEGKSALRDAIAFALTGALPRPGVVLRNEIGALAVRLGAKKAVVRLELEGLSVQRTVSRDGSQDLDVQVGDQYVEGIRGGQAAVYTHLRLDEGRALAALDAWGFLGLPEADARALLVRTLGAAITGEHVRKLLHERGLDETRGEKVAEIAASQGFRAAEKVAIEKRREAGRALEEHGGEPPSRMVKISGRDLDLTKGPTRDEFQARLTELREKRDGLLKGGAEMVGVARNLIKALGPRKQELEELIAGLPPDDGSDPEALRAELAELTEDCRVYSKSRDEAVAALNAARERLSAAENGTKPTSCPVLGGACLATPKRIAERLMELEQQRAPLETKVADATLVFDQLTEQLETAGAKRDALQGSLGGLVERRKTESDARAELTQVTREIDHNLTVLGDHGQKVEAGTTSPITELDDRIVNNEAALRAREAYDAALAAWETKATRVRELTADRDAWDGLAQAMKPTGVESDLLRELVPAFAGRASEITQAVGLGELQVSDDLDLRILRGGIAWAPAQLSRSARLRLGIAIQHAIASLAGFPLLVVDEIDVFNSEVQPFVLGALMQASARYAAVLGLATLRVGAPAAPKSDKVALMWLRDGAVEVVAS